MFCALKGATSSPASARRRHNPAATTLLPTSDAVPSTARAVFTLKPARSGRLLPRALHHGEAGLLPRGEAAVHLIDGLEAHLLGDVGGEGRPPRAVAIEDEALAGAEDLFAVRALRIDPEFQHAARTMHGVGDHPLPLELTHIAQVHEHRVILAVPGVRLLEAERLDPGLRLVDELPKALLELHGFLLSGSTASSLHSTPWTADGLAGKIRPGCYTFGRRSSYQRRGGARSRRRGRRRPVAGVHADRVIESAPYLYRGAIRARRARDQQMRAKSR